MSYCPSGCPFVLHPDAPDEFEVCETCGIERVLRPPGSEGWR